MTLLATITAKVNAIACRFAPDCPGVERPPTLRQLQLIEDLLEYAERELRDSEAHHE